MSDYKLMPAEPSVEMERAAESYWNERRFKGLSDDPRTWAGVYKAMRAVAPTVQGEPVGWQFYQHGEWWNGDDRIKDHRKNTEEAGFRVRDVYATSQPELLTVDVMVGALEQVIKAAPSSGPLWHGSEQIVEARSALRHAEIVLTALDYRKKGEGV